MTPLSNGHPIRIIPEWIEDVAEDISGLVLGVTKEDAIDAIYNDTVLDQSKTMRTHRRKWETVVDCLALLYGK